MFIVAEEPDCPSKYWMYKKKRESRAHAKPGLRKISIGWTPAIPQQCLVLSLPTLFTSDSAPNANYWDQDLRQQEMSKNLNEEKTRKKKKTKELRQQQKPYSYPKHLSEKRKTIVVENDVYHNWPKSKGQNHLATLIYWNQLNSHVHGYRLLNSR